MTVRVFIASSSEGLPWAKTVQRGLKSCQCTVWDQNVFPPSTYTLPSLETALRSNDYGVFVFSPDDMIKMRGNEYPVARDNVILELGMFVGQLGFDHCFIIRPDDPDFHLPSDLGGLTTEMYTPLPPGGNIDAHLGAVCSTIENVITGLEQNTDPLAKVDEAALTYIVSHSDGTYRFTTENLRNSPYALNRQLLDTCAQADWYTYFQRVILLTPPHDGEPGLYTMRINSNLMTSSDTYTTGRGFETAEERDSFTYTKLLIDGNDVTDAWNASKKYTDHQLNSSALPFGVNHEVPWGSTQREHKIHAEYSYISLNPVIMRNYWVLPHPVRFLTQHISFVEPFSHQWTLFPFVYAAFRNLNSTAYWINFSPTSVSVNFNDWALPGTGIAYVAYPKRPPLTGLS